MRDVEEQAHAAHWRVANTHDTDKSVKDKGHQVNGVDRCQAGRLYGRELDFSRRSLKKN